MDTSQPFLNRGKLCAGLCLIIVSWLVIMSGSFIAVNNYLRHGYSLDKAGEDIRLMKNHIDRLKDDTRKLNESVVSANIHLNRLIERSAEVNGKIGELMEYSLTRSDVRDSIEMLYQEQMTTLEPGIDSVNQVFREQSALMLEKLIVLGEKEKDQRIMQAAVKHHQTQLLFLRIFCLILIITGIPAMVWGLVLFTRALKKT